jgi:hypothetical protein
MLGGCFSMQVKQNIDNAAADLQSSYGKALDWGEFSGTRHLSCPQVCSDSMAAWRVDISETPIYLVLLRDEALLTDSLSTCKSASVTRYMDLVIADAPIDFHPTDSDSLATAALQLKLRHGASWSSEGTAMRQGSSLLFLRQDSVVRLPVNVLLHPVQAADVRSAQIRSALPLFLTIPLDVVTSPFQLLTAWLWIEGVKGQKH